MFHGCDVRLQSDHSHCQQLFITITVNISKFVR